MRRNDNIDRRRFIGVAALGIASSQLAAFRVAERFYRDPPR